NLMHWLRFRAPADARRLLADFGEPLSVPGWHRVKWNCRGSEWSEMPLAYSAATGITTQLVEWLPTLDEEQSRRGAAGSFFVGLRSSLAIAATAGADARCPAAADPSGVVAPCVRAVPDARTPDACDEPLRPVPAACGADPLQRPQRWPCSAIDA